MIYGGTNPPKLVNYCISSHQIKAAWGSCISHFCGGTLLTSRWTTPRKFVKGDSLLASIHDGCMLTLGKPREPWYPV